MYATTLLSGNFAMLWEAGYFANRGNNVNPSPSPTPEPVPEEKLISQGTITFRFSNSSIDQTTLDALGVSYCTWSKVANSEYNDWNASLSILMKKYAKYAIDKSASNSYVISDGATLTRNGNIITAVVSITLDEGAEEPTDEQLDAAYAWRYQEYYTDQYKPTHEFTHTYDESSRKLTMTIVYTYPEVLVASNQPSFSQLLTSSLDNDIHIISETLTLTNCPSMFNSCTGITEIEPGLFNNITYGSSMFAYCSNLKTVSANCFASLVNADGMFNSCKSITTLPNNSFNSVDNGNNMFKGCSGLTSLPDDSFTNVTIATSMFSYYTTTGEMHLTSLGNNTFQHVTNAGSMFFYCSKLTSNVYDILAKWSENGANIKHAFRNDTSVGDFATAYAKFNEAFT